MPSRGRALDRGPQSAGGFPSPLIKPDVPISSIRLSDRLHPQLTEDFATKRRRTPSCPNTIRSEYLAVPSEGTLWRRRRNTLRKDAMRCFIEVDRVSNIF